MHHADRHLIETWAASTPGRLLDAGCGPGHWTGHLARLGADIRGIDLVPEFIAHARAAHPGIRFDVASIDAIDEPDGSLGGILAWFSTIHHEPSRIGIPLAEFARTLRPGGGLLLGYFDGDALEALRCASRRRRGPRDGYVKVRIAARRQVPVTGRTMQRAIKLPMS